MEIIPVAVFSPARIKHRDEVLMNISLPSHRSSPLLSGLLSVVLIGMLSIGGPASASGSLAAILAGQAGAAAAIPLNPQHPQRYVVQRGDTLWDISGMFLRDPWYWPEIWYANPQVENPHLIYPGDVLTLVYVDGRPQIRLERGGVVQAGNTERLSPRIREEALDAAITTIRFEVISAFLSKGSVLEKDEIDELPYMVAIREGHLMASAGNDVYVRGNTGGVGSGYSIVHIGDELIEPDDDEVVGYEGIFAGEGTITRAGDPATMFLNKTRREALEGDRLVEQEFRVPLNFYPRSPETQVNGRIIHVVDGVSLIGQYMIVVLNRGSSHGLDEGHVLSVWQTGAEIEDRFASRFKNEKITLPDERAGHLMVFKTYDRISYALVMEATSEIHVLDKVENPD